jgi:hypothetical protein
MGLERKKNDWTEQRSTAVISCAYRCALKEGNFEAPLNQAVFQPGLQSVAVVERKARAKDSPNHLPIRTILPASRPMGGWNHFQRLIFFAVCGALNSPMFPIRLLTVLEQTVEHLRRSLVEGRWRGRLPGVMRLAAECNVSKGVIRTALQQLEAEGFLQDRGVGRSREVAQTLRVGVPQRAMRVGILLNERMADENPGMQSTLLRIKHTLEEAGNVCFLSAKCQAGLHHDLNRIAGYLETAPADAWVLVAPRVELLEWFDHQTKPCIYLGSRRGNFQLAGAGLDLKPSMQEATRQLLELGHQRKLGERQQGRSWLQHIPPGARLKNILRHFIVNTGNQCNFSSP